MKITKNIMRTEIVMILSCLSFLHIGASSMRNTAFDKKVDPNCKGALSQGRWVLRYDITDKYDDKFNYKI